MISECSVRYDASYSGKFISEGKYDKFIYK